MVILLVFLYLQHVPDEIRVWPRGEHLLPRGATFPSRICHWGHQGEWPAPFPTLPFICLMIFFKLFRFYHSTWDSIVLKGIATMNWNCISRFTIHDNEHKIIHNVYIIKQLGTIKHAVRYKTIIAYSIAVTWLLSNISEFAFTIDIPSLTLTGELWSVNCESMKTIIKIMI